MSKSGKYTIPGLPLSTLQQNSAAVSSKNAVSGNLVGRHLDRADTRMFRPVNLSQNDSKLKKNLDASDDGSGGVRVPPERHYTSSCVSTNLISSQAAGGDCKTADTQAAQSVIFPTRQYNCATGAAKPRRQKATKIGTGPPSQIESNKVANEGLRGNGPPGADTYNDFRRNNKRVTDSAADELHCKEESALTTIISMSYGATTATPKFAPHRITPEAANPDGTLCGLPPMTALKKADFRATSVPTLTRGRKVAHCNAHNEGTQKVSEEEDSGQRIVWHDMPRRDRSLPVCSRRSNMLSIYKWIIHRVTRRCELERTSQTFQPKAVELCLSQSKQLAAPSKAILTTLFPNNNDNEGHINHNNHGYGEPTRSIQNVVQDVMDKKDIKDPAGFRQVFERNLSAIQNVTRVMILVERYSRCQFNSNNEQHEQMLKRLWDLLMPDKRLAHRICRDWQSVGFQGRDPASDFRGCGILGLGNLLYFAENYNGEARAMLRESHHAFMWYSFAVAGINISSWLRQWLVRRPGFRARKSCRRKKYCDLYSFEEDEPIAGADRSSKPGADLSSTPLLSAADLSSTPLLAAADLSSSVSSKECTGFPKKGKPKSSTRTAPAPRPLHEVVSRPLPEWSSSDLTDVDDKEMVQSSRNGMMRCHHNNNRSDVDLKEYSMALPKGNEQPTESTSARNGSGKMQHLRSDTMTNCQSTFNRSLKSVTSNAMSSGSFERGDRDRRWWSSSDKCSDCRSSSSESHSFSSEMCSSSSDEPHDSDDASSRGRGSFDLLSGVESGYLRYNNNISTTRCKTRIDYRQEREPRQYSDICLGDLKKQQISKPISGKQQQPHKFKHNVGIVKGNKDSRMVSQNYCGSYDESLDCSSTRRTLVKNTSSTSKQSNNSCRSDVIGVTGEPSSICHISHPSKKSAKQARTVCMRITPPENLHDYFYLAKTDLESMTMFNKIYVFIFCCFHHYWFASKPSSLLDFPRIAANFKRELKLPSYPELLDEILRAKQKEESWQRGPPGLRCIQPHTHNP